MAAPDLPATIAALKAAFPRVSEETEMKEDLPCVVVGRDDILGVLEMLRRAGFDFLLDLTAVDYPARADRFEIVYHLYSFEGRQRVRVKTRAAAGESVPTASGLWKSVNWFEREVFDLFGVQFEGHPNLVRIVMPDDWVGHPLRKDYPIGGENVQF